MRVSQDEIIEMNELYLEYGTYSAVAREVGRAPSTVKRYIDLNYQSQLLPKQLKPINWDLLKSVPVIKIINWEQEFLEKNNG